MHSTAAIASYIANHPQIESLYEKPLFTQGILRLLDERTTQLVFSLICNSIHISRLEEVPGYEDGLELLTRIKLVTKTDGMISLSKTFRNALLSGLSSALPESTLLNEEMDNLSLPSYEAVKSISQRKFKHILSLIVNRTTESEPGVSKLLLSAHLVDEQGNITNKGFEFLLQSRSEQQWHLVLCAVKCFSRSVEDEFRMLSVVMELCIKAGGSIYRLQEWSPWHALMESIGVLHVLKRDGKHTTAMIVNDDFFPQSSSEITKNIFLILETNFKIYAYTSQIYERSILNLFSEPLYVLPNLVKAEFNEHAAKAVFDKGITASQIIRYLKNYSSGVPTNVENQLIIWENGLQRVKENKAVLYTDFNHLSDFLMFRAMLNERNAVLYCDERRRILIAKEEVYNHAKEFLRHLK